MIRAVIATIDITPITTPRIVSAERILLARSVSNAMTRISQSMPTRIATTYSRLRASMGSSFEARIAGYRPKNSPTMAVMLMPMITAQSSILAGMGEK